MIKHHNQNEIRIFDVMIKCLGIVWCYLLRKHPCLTAGSCKHQLVTLTFLKSKNYVSAAQFVLYIETQHFNF